MLVGVVLAVTWLSPVEASPWTRLPSGLDVRRIAAGPGVGEGIHLVRLDPKLHELRAFAPEAGAPSPPFLASAVQASTSALAVVNASYFDPAGRPLGLVVSGGRRLSPLNARGWAGAAIVGSRLVAFDARSGEPAGTTEAVQAGPRLVVAGNARHLASPRTARRSFVGADRQGRIVLGATTNAMTLGALARILAAEEPDGGVGLETAVNLDGGSSTQLVIAGDDPALKVVGIPVPVFLIVVPRTAAGATPSGP